MIPEDPGKVRIMILDSSMVEHSAVNRVVVGSSPTRGANEINNLKEKQRGCFSGITKRKDKAPWSSG